ncbi:sulfite exporter TauE/SafE family protein [Antarcticimicrobium sediminis]|uniref:Probable membrane transporter protein n=1 Tax=Antarcticimicrobium sediminis TaxID=2546227 RepID=A0A4R5ELM4_9RHOB|nr:sulfite exporter TauE/SafE family protein [Antarcticimicrobium sediminis]
MMLTLIISAAVFFAAVLRGLTGFGFALAAVPAMSLVVAPARAVAIAITLQCLVGLRDVVTMRAFMDRQALVLLSIGALVGTPIGVVALTQLSPDAMRIVLALVVFAGLAALLARVQLPPNRTPALIAGMLSGVFSGLAAMPGPPAIAYFLGRASGAVATRASLMVFFFITSLMTLPGLLIADRLDRSTVILAVSALPALLIGTWAGGRMFTRLGEGGYRTAASVLLAFTAIATGLRGLAAYL